MNIVPPSFAATILKAAAVAPPSVKTELFQRICAAFARRQGSLAKCLVRTNLGISARFHCYLPLEKWTHVFGRPDHNLSERSTLALTSILCRDCTHFVDVGANEGIFTFVVAHETGGEVEMHWFEPDGDLFARVEKNLSLNSIRTNGNKIALSNTIGVAVFYKNMTDDLSGSLVNHFAKMHDTREQAIEITTLSEYFSRHQVANALVKVDVEGHGAKVWDGARAIADKITYLVMEMIGPEIGARLPEEIIAQTGWNAYYVRDFDLVHAPDGSFKYKEPFWNWLFCQMGPAELALKLSHAKFRVC